MDIGVVLQTTPTERPRRGPREASRDLRVQPRVDVRQPPAMGGAVPDLHARTSRTRTVTVGPMVANPLTRDWTVTASLFATLNEMFGNRTVKRDRPWRLGGARDQRAAVDAPALGEAVHVIRELGERARGLLPGLDAAVPVGRQEPGRGVDGRVRTQGAAADRRGGRRVHPAARRPRHHGVDDRRRAAGRGGGGPRSRRRSRSAWRRPPTSAKTSGTRETSAGGSAAWWATTSPTSWPATARPRRFPRP